MKKVLLISFALLLTSCMTPEDKEYMTLELEEQSDRIDAQARKLNRQEQKLKHLKYLRCKVDRDQRWRDLERCKGEVRCLNNTHKIWNENFRSTGCRR